MSHIQVRADLLFAALDLFELTAGDMQDIELREINAATLFIMHDGGVGHIIPLRKYGPYEVGWADGSPVLAYRITKEAT